MTGKLYQAMLPTLRSLLTAAGSIAYGVSGGSPLALPLGTKGNGLFAGASAPFYDTLARKNYLINGGLGVAQRGLSGAGFASNAYTVDRWRIVQQGGTISWTASAAAAAAAGGGRFDLTLVPSTTGNKLGLFQVIEGRHMWDLRGQTVSLQFKAAATGGISDVRGIVMYLTAAGTEDSVSADPISAWNAAGTTPTPSGNWVVINTPTANVPTGSYATFKAENIVIPTTAKNVAVLVYSDDNAYAGGADIVLFSDIQLEKGAVCTEFERRSFSQELLDCQRYYWKTFAQGVTPAQNVASNVGALEVIAPSATAGAIQVPIRFPVVMRVTPTITTYNPRAANTGWATAAADASIGASNLAAGDGGATIYGTGPGVAGTDYYIHATASSEL